MIFSRRIYYSGAAVLLTAGLLATAGCARRYNIVLTNGTQLTAASKPKLENGFYVFNDASGKPQYISQGRVREISHGSGSSSPQQFKTVPASRR